MSNTQQINKFRTGGFAKYQGIVFEIVAVLKTDQLLLASIGAPVPIAECQFISKNLAFQYRTNGHTIKTVKPSLNNKLK